MQNIRGHYSFAGRSDMRPAEVTISDTGHISVVADGVEIRSAHLNECREGDILPGLPIDLIFPDDDRFIPATAGQRWMTHQSAQSLISWMESHTVTILASLVIVPLFLWLLVTQGIPALSATLAPVVPDSFAQQMGESQKKFIDYLMDPSELPEDQQQQILAYWNHARQEAGLDHRYEVVFYNTPQVNAFALANGTLIVTDALVEAMDYRNDLIAAVLFHEAGHVDLHHNVRMVLQTGTSSLIYTLIFGDMEGLSDMILGAGLSLTENSYSRTMESEADQFAIAHLQRSGHPASVMADAFRNLPGADEKANSVFELLSSHPELQDRIRTAEEAEARTTEQKQ